MHTAIDLAATARARLKDATALLAQGQYDGAAYICGYAVEIAIKARIVKTLKWPGFPSDNKEFSGLQSFRSHDLELLLYMRMRGKNEGATAERMAGGVSMDSGVEVRQTRKCPEDRGGANDRGRQKNRRSSVMKTFAEKLEKVAEVVAREHPKLNLFAVVPFSMLPDRWDLIISSDSLRQETEGLNRFKYIVEKLKKQLTAKEMVKISHVAFLPPDDPLVASLLARSNGQLDLGESFPDDDFERATVLWPAKQAQIMTQTA